VWFVWLCLGHGASQIHVRRKGRLVTATSLGPIFRQRRLPALTSSIAVDRTDGLNWLVPVSKAGVVVIEADGHSARSRPSKSLSVFTRSARIVPLTRKNDNHLPRRVSRFGSSSRIASDSLAAYWALPLYSFTSFSIQILTRPTLCYLSQYRCLFHNAAKKAVI
jgi:hypothetical protein